MVMSKMTTLSEDYSYVCFRQGGGRRYPEGQEIVQRNSATHGRWWRHCTESQQNTFGGGQTTLNITACMFQTAFPSTVFLWCDVCQL